MFESSQNLKFNTSNGEKSLFFCQFDVTKVNWHLNLFLTVSYMYKVTYNVM